MLAAKKVAHLSENMNELESEEFDEDLRKVEGSDGAQLSAMEVNATKDIVPSYAESILKLSPLIELSGYLKDHRLPGLEVESRLASSRHTS